MKPIVENIQSLPSGLTFFKARFHGTEEQQWVVTRPPTRNDPNHAILHSRDRIADLNLRTGTIRVSESHPGGADANAFLDDKFSTSTIDGVPLAALRLAISQAKIAEPPSV